MENRKTFTYNGVNSADYGLYISGDSVYNAPSRVYDMVDIAGRNGQLAIDQGRFENIEVTYPAFIFAETQTEFAQRLREIRAWLMSPVGYQRLEDTYHPDEFRMAIYMSGLEADPTHYSEAGEFELTFNCKPQRFLKSGEEEITIGEWGETETVSGSIATFEAESNTGIKSLVANIVPIQEGSGDPSPTNVRPISGWDTVRVEKSGKNLLWNMQADTYTTNGITYTKTADGKVIANGTATANAWYKLTEGFVCKTPMILSGCPSGGSISTYEIQLDGVSNVHDFGSGVSFNTSGSGKFYIVVRSGQTVNNLVFEPMVRLATESAEYEPYQGSSYSIPLGQTVYGGVLDVVRGKLVIDREFKQVASTDTMRMVGDICQVNYAPPSDNAWQSLICSHFPTKSIWSGTTNEGIGCWGGQFYFRWLAIGTTIEAWRQFFTDNNVQFTYTLATPIEVNLTPTEVNTLLGSNNIWADSGEVSVEFGADPNILVNPTPFEALPIFEVVGTGSLTVGNTTINITGDSAQDIFIDSDIMEAYEDDNGAIISRNDRINLSGMNFPTLGTDTGITYTGLTSVKVTPRWWTI